MMCMLHDKNIKVRGENPSQGNLDDNFRDDIDCKRHFYEFNDVSSGSFLDFLLNLTLL